MSRWKPRSSSSLREAGTIDILVNSVWGGYDRMIEDGDFTWPKPFWEQPLWRWDAMFSAGVRAHYQASQLAAPSMIAQRRGLIVNISHWAAQKHIGNVAYGVSKAATDKMTSDMATELKPPRCGRGLAVPGNGPDGKGHGSGPVARLEQFRIPRVHWTGRRRPRRRS